MNISVHEDNVVALLLARTLKPHFTPHSKYYVANIIWFHEDTIKHGFELLKIDTVKQLGNLFIRGLPRPTFEYLSKKIMGCQMFQIYRIHPR